MTNLLVNLINADQAQGPILIQELLNIHLKIAQELNLSIDDKIKKEVARLDQLLNTDIIDKEKIDNILSLGENLSSILVYAFLNLQGIKIDLIDIRNYLITDDHFGKATPEISIIKERMQNLPTNIYITQGFIDSTLDGKTTKLGRGGSDYSAAIVAEAIEDDELLIYTNVPGAYTMDPNTTEEAQLIEELNFQEMAEMANFGVKVLHTATIEPCVRSRTGVRILSTFEPERNGTLINIKDNKSLASRIGAITMRSEQVLVTITSLKMLNAYGFLVNTFSILAKYKISIDLIITSEVKVALTIDNISTGSHARNPFIYNQELLNELKQFAEVIVEENLTLLAVIGSRLTVPGIIQKALGVIEPFMLRLVCYGASNSSISVLVDKDNAVEMAKLLHKKLLGEAYV
ncbi:MAG: aspartate kinase [Candidatus Midichloria sp.]|uniref:Aspartokinase n=1 Tax=Hyalomma marginatum TaxID=34627 RepID=A0A8S4C129_9ACAR|nr:aspartate kinase [Hyalomma marginatum]CAG7596164.1 aspartate kinase [Hyalomma marginatum]